MMFRRKVYKTRYNKGTDLILGVLVAIGINILLLAFVPFGLSLAGQTGSLQNGNNWLGMFFFGLALPILAY